MLRTENISFQVGGKEILRQVSASFLPGEMNMILGPNGSGKSTFLKIFSGETKHYSGRVFYDNESIEHIKPEDLARKRAVMSQQPELGFPMAVEEVVMMGRYPHFTFNPGKKDRDICEAALEKMKLADFRERNYLTLSGGEKQRVQFARLLAQVWDAGTNGNRYLFLDEPLNNLDINYQQEFLQALRAACDSSTTIVAVMHDINLALQYADHISFFKDGAIVASGKPATLITEKLIADIFSVQVSVINHPVTNGPLVVFRQ